MMITFGLISEGKTDQIILEDILSGYFGEDEINVNSLQPKITKDKLGNWKINHDKFGNWLNVFNYCESDGFRQAFQSNDYIVIQIDTDVSEEPGYDILKSDENGKLFPLEEIIQKVKEKLILLIGRDFYAANFNRIIFAISVHSIECWLLPLYYQDKRKAEIKNCTSKLAQAVNKKEKFYLDPESKDTKIYAKISYQYNKKRTLLKHYFENPSFIIFIEELKSKVSDNTH